MSSTLSKSQVDVETLLCCFMQTTLSEFGTYLLGLGAETETASAGSYLSRCLWKIGRWIMACIYSRLRVGVLEVNSWELGM